MDYIEKIKNTWFKNHEHILQNHGLLLKLIWSNKNKKSEYDIRYVFDENYIYITSIMGNVIVELDKKVDLNVIQNYSLGKFAKRIKYREEKISFDTKTIIQTINDYIMENSNLDNIIKDFFNKLKYHALLTSSRNDWIYKVNEIKKDYKIGSSNYNWLYEAGDKYCFKIIAYWLGLKMVHESIKKSLLSKGA